MAHAWENSYELAAAGVQFRDRVITVVSYPYRIAGRCYSFRAVQVRSRVNADELSGAKGLGGLVPGQQRIRDEAGRQSNAKYGPCDGQYPATTPTRALDRTGNTGSLPGGRRCGPGRFSGHRRWYRLCAYMVLGGRVRTAGPVLLGRDLGHGQHWSTVDGRNRGRHGDGS